MTVPSELTVSLLEAEVPVDDRRERRLFFRQQVFFWVPLGALVLIALACFLGPIVFPIPSPTGGTIVAANRAILSAGHLLGTDPSGNDNLSKVLYGGRVSLEVGFATVFVGLIVGGGLGAIAGQRGGWVEVVISRLFDALLSFPALVLAIVIATYLGPSELHVIYAISFFSIPAVGRLARANTLRIRSSTFFSAARIAGTGEWKILWRHIAPNILPNLLTFSFLSVSVSIIAEAALSFLGLGVPPPNPSWGNMLSLGEQYLDLRAVLLFIPAVAIFLTILSLNLAGDALRARWAE
jgi:peptide/nickel transport system permease protein